MRWCVSCKAGRLISVSAPSTARYPPRYRSTPVSYTHLAIKRLETTLNIRLFARSTRSLRLTPEGETWLPYACLLYTSRCV